MERPNKVWIDNERIWLKWADGLCVSELFDRYPRLREATPQQRADYQLTPWGIRWEAIDEDLSYQGFLAQSSSSKTPESSRD